MRKNLLVFAGVILFAIQASFSQSDNPFVNRVDSVTAYLNKSYITTGILYDRMPPLAALDLFNPQIDTSDYHYFTQAYFEIFYGAYNNGSWLSPGKADSLIWDNNISGIVPIGVLDYQFNMMDSLAVQDNLFTWQNGFLYDVPGRPRSPYFLKRIQLVAPLANSIDAGSIKLKYMPQFYKSNLGFTISSITITGLTPSPINLPLNGTTVNVSLTTGYKSMQIQVVYTNGQQFTRTAGLQVEGTNFVTRTTDDEGPEANDPYWFSSTIAYQGYDETTPYYGKNHINVYSRGTDNTLKPIIKPIIIIDGFDPKDIRRAPKIYTEAFSYVDNNNQGHNFADELRASGFDVVIVDHPDYNDDTRTRNDPNNLQLYPRSIIDGNLVTTVHGGGDYIQRNAMVLVTLIQDINAQLQANNSTAQIIIVGPSMGGQISRYALRYMETHGMNHNCKLWVSFDSPHQGALLPIGLQRMAKGLSGVSKEAKKTLDVQINCSAAKQMLVHHYTSEQEMPAGAIQDGIHFKDLYYQELDNMGWPENCRKIAMISGADNGSSVQPGGGGSHAISVSARPSFLSRFLLFLLFKPSAIFDVEVIGADCYLAPNLAQQRGGVFQGHILFNQLTTHYAQAPSNANQTIDLIPSGFYPGFAELKETSDKSWGKKFGRFFLSQQITAFLNIHAHEFVYSTLALGKGPYPNPNRKWDDNISNINVTCGLEKESPFDAYWGPDVNTRHDQLLYGHVTRLVQEFNDVHMANKSITQNISNSSTGPWCVSVRRTFQILNPKAGQTFIWGTSNPGLVIRNGQFSSTVEIEYTGGNITTQDYISCQSTSPCYNITVPNFSLQSVHFGGFSSSDYPVYGPSSSCRNTYVYFSTNVLEGATDYAWFWPASNWTYISGNHTPYLALRTGTMSGPVGVRVANICDAGGSPAIKFVQILNCGRFAFSTAPNPTTGSMNVSVIPNSKLYEGKTSQSRIYLIKVVDLTGNVKRQYRYPFGITSTNIDLKGLASGMYVIHAYNGSEWSYQKILKQ